MNPSTTNPLTEAPTERQKPNGMPGSLSVYSIRMFGMSYGRMAAPSTEMKSTPFGGRPPMRFISDCCTMRIMNATGLPGRVDGRRHPHVGDRAVEVVLHVVFARPDDLHRLADGFRRFDRVGDEVGFAAASEAAAEIRREDVDLVGGQTARGHGRLLRCGLPLRRHPHVAPVGAHVRRAVHRLHRRVREERHLEHALERFRRALDGRGGVAVVARHLARLLGELRVVLRDVRAVQRRQLALVPLHLERLRAFRCRPVVVGDHG